MPLSTNDGVSLALTAISLKVFGISAGGSSIWCRVAEAVMEMGGKCLDDGNTEVSAHPLAGSAVTVGGNLHFVAVEAVPCIVSSTESAKDVGGDGCSDAHGTADEGSNGLAKEVTRVGGGLRSGAIFECMGDGTFAHPWVEGLGN